MPRHLLRATLAVAAIAAFVPPAHAAGWTAVRLMGEHADYLFPHALNDAGVAVGRTDGRELHPTDALGVMRRAGHPAVTFVADGQRLTEAMAIASDGTIAGNAGTGPFDVHEAFVRMPDGTVRTLFAAGTVSSAWGVDASHRVVGAAAQADGSDMAYVWKDGAVTWLGSLGSPGSVASAINDAGTVVGVAATDTPYHFHAFRWRDGVMSDLGSLPDDADDTSGASAINASGLVVGNCGVSMMRACAWGADGQARDLGLPAGHVAGSARAVNDLGVAVGWSLDAQNQQRAVVFHDGIAEDLNALVADVPAGIVLTEAVAINHDGGILVHAAQGRRHMPVQYVLMPK